MPAVDHRLHSRSTISVDSVRNSIGWNARFNRDHAGHVGRVRLSRNIAHDNFVHVRWQQSTTSQHIRDRMLAELYRRLTIIHPNAIEFRPVERFNPHEGTSGRPYRHVWIKATEKVELSLPIQQQMLAYASDYNLLGTAAIPHLHRTDYNKLFFASLDHAMYFHRDFRIDDWLLYALDSPSASNSRGFSRGNIFNQEGQLVSSVVQEGLIREMRKK